MPTNMKLVVGRASTEVSLVKVTQPVAAARHETRRVYDEGVLVSMPAAAPAASRPAEPAVQDAVDSTWTTVDPFADDAPAPKPEVMVDAASETTVTSLSVQPAPSSRVEQGVYYDGEWVNLTEKLAEIDKSSKLDGMRIEATINEMTGLRVERIRDAQYIVPKDPASHKFLARIWAGLRANETMAVVRFSKSKEQYLGLIAARLEREMGKPYLLLYEVEWAHNIRAVPPSAILDISVLTSRQEVSATRAMANTYAASDYVDGLVNERWRRRKDLLAAAREGKVAATREYDVTPSVEELGELLLAEVE